MQRIDFENYLVILANIVKLRSQDEYRKVGCVGATIDNRIITTGYNGLASGFSPPEDFYKDREDPIREIFTFHAEMNALNLCKRGEIHTLAITCSPCSNCAKTIAMHGVKKVLYSEEYCREKKFREIFDFYGIEYKFISFDKNNLIDLL